MEPQKETIEDQLYSLCFSQSTLDRTIEGCAKQISEIEVLTQKYGTPVKSSVKRILKAINHVHTEKKLMDKLRIFET